MTTVRSALACGLAVATLSTVLTGCGSPNPQPVAVTQTEVVYHDVIYGVVESIQLVQVVPPPAGAGTVAGTPVAPSHSTYQIGVRLNQGGYQVFTQDDAVDLHVGQPVRVDHGVVHHG